MRIRRVLPGHRNFVGSLVIDADGSRRRAREPSFRLTEGEDIPMKTLTRATTTATRDLPDWQTHPTLIAAQQRVAAMTGRVERLRDDVQRQDDEVTACAAELERALEGAAVGAVSDAEVARKRARLREATQRRDDIAADLERATRVQKTEPRRQIEAAEDAAYVDCR